MKKKCCAWIWVKWQFHYLCHTLAQNRARPSASVPELSLRWLEDKVIHLPNAQFILPIYLSSVVTVLNYLIFSALTGLQRAVVNHNVVKHWRQRVGCILLWLTAFGDKICIPLVNTCKDCYENKSALFVLLLKNKPKHPLNEFHWSKTTESGGVGF